MIENFELTDFHNHKPLETIDYAVLLADNLGIPVGFTEWATSGASYQFNQSLLDAINHKVEAARATAAAVITVQRNQLLDDNNSNSNTVMPSMPMYSKLGMHYSQEERKDLGHCKKGGSSIKKDRMRQSPVLDGIWEATIAPVAITSAAVEIQQFPSHIGQNNISQAIKHDYAAAQSQRCLVPQKQFSDQASIAEKNSNHDSNLVCLSSTDADSLKKEVQSGYLLFQRYEKDSFIMFIIFLLWYLEQKDRPMHQKVKSIIRDFANRKNQQQKKKDDKGYESDNGCLYLRLLKEVGKKYCYHAEYLSRFFMRKKAGEQQEEEKQKTKQKHHVLGKSLVAYLKNTSNNKMNKAAYMIEFFARSDFTTTLTNTTSVGKTTGGREYTTQFELNGDYFNLLSNDEANFLLDRIGMLVSNLHSFTISKGAKIQDQYWITLTNIFKSSPILKEINIRDVHVSDIGMKSIVQLLQNNDCALRFLAITSCNLRDRDFIALGSALQSSIHLQSLHIFKNTSITKTGYMAIVDALEQNISLYDVWCVPMEIDCYKIMEFYLSLNNNTNTTTENFMQRKQIMLNDNLTRSQYVEFLLQVFKRCRLSSARQLSLLYYFIQKKPLLLVGFIEENDKMNNNTVIFPEQNKSNRIFPSRLSLNLLNMFDTFKGGMNKSKKILKIDDQPDAIKTKKYRKMPIEEYISQRIDSTEGCNALNFSSYILDDDDCLVLADAIKYNSNLQRIRFDENNVITSTGWKAIFHSLVDDGKNNDDCNLQSLELSTNFLSDNDCIEFATALKRNVTIKELTLYSIHDIINTNIEIGYEAIAQSLKTNHTIEKLFLHMSIFDTDCIAIANALRQNTGLKMLLLTWNKTITHKGWSALADALKYNSSLETLSLNNCNLDDEDCASFSNAIKVNKGMKYIEIGDNPRITSDGIKALAGALEYNCVLESLEYDRKLLQKLQTVREEIKYYTKFNKELNERIASLNHDKAKLVQYKRKTILIYIRLCFVVFIATMILYLEMLND